MEREQEISSEEIDAALREIRGTVKRLIDDKIVDFGTREHRKELREELGSRLRTLREEKGMSLNSFARKTDFDPGHVSRMERGLVGVSRNFINEASDVLETSTLDLLVLGGYFEIDEDRITDRDYEIFRFAIDKKLIRFY